MKTRLTDIKSIELSIEAQHLWEILTSPSYSKKYMFNCEVESDWKKGSSITWQGNYQGYDAFQKGEILDISPYTLIKYTTFDPNYGFEDIPENYIHITYDIQEFEGYCKLTVINETFDGNKERMGHISEGWKMVLNTIKEICSST